MTTYICNFVLFLVVKFFETIAEVVTWMNDGTVLKINFGPSSSLRGTQVLDSFIAQYK